MAESAHAAVEAIAAPAGIEIGRVEIDGSVNGRVEVTVDGTRRVAGSPWEEAVLVLRGGARALCFPALADEERSLGAPGPFVARFSLPETLLGELEGLLRLELDGTQIVLPLAERCALRLEPDADPCEDFEPDHAAALSAADSGLAEARATILQARVRLDQLARLAETLQERAETERSMRESADVELGEARAAAARAEQAVEALQAELERRAELQARARSFIDRLHAEVDDLRTVSADEHEARIAGNRMMAEFVTSAHSALLDAEAEIERARSAAHDTERALRHERAGRHALEAERDEARSAHAGAEEELRRVRAQQRSSEGALHGERLRAQEFARAAEREQAAVEAAAEALQRECRHRAELEELLETERLALAKLEREHEERLVALRAQATDLEQARARHHEAVAAWEAQTAEQRQVVEGLQAQLAERDAHGLELERERDCLQAQLQAAKRSQDESRARLAQAEARLTEEAAEAQERLAARANEVQECLTEQASAHDRAAAELRASLEERSATISQRLAHATQAIRVLRRRVEELERELAAERSARADADSRQRDQGRRVREAEADAAVLRTRHNALSEEHHRLRDRLGGEARARLQAQTDSVRDQAARVQAALSSSQQPGGDEPVPALEAPDIGQASDVAPAPTPRLTVLQASDAPIPWLARALRTMAAQDPDAAAPLLLDLIAAQALTATRPVDYDLELAGAGRYAVSLCGARASIRSIDLRRPDREVAFRLLVGPPAMVELLIAGPTRRVRHLPGVEVQATALPGRALRPLCPAPLAYHRLARAGLWLDPRLTVNALCQLVEPAWTAGHRFSVEIRVLTPEACTFFVTVDGEAEPRVSLAAPRGGARAAVTLSRPGFHAMLGGRQAGADAAGGRLDAFDVEGDIATVRLLIEWLDRARGARSHWPVSEARAA